MNDSITPAQKDFLEKLVSRIDFNKLPPTLQEIWNSWNNQVYEKIPQFSKSDASVAISFFLYLESVTKNGRFIDALGAVKFP